MGQTSFPNLESFEILQTGLIAVPSLTISSVGGAWGNGIATTTQAHGLQITDSPIVLGFMVAQSGNYYSLLPYTSLSNRSLTEPLNINVNIAADTKNVYITSTGQSYFSTNNSVTYSGWGNVKYYLLREKAN